MAAGLMIAVAMMALAPVISLLWLLAAVILMLGVAEGALDVGAT